MMGMNGLQKKLYCVKDAAGLVDELSEYMLRKMIKEGRIEPYRIGRKIYLTEEQVYQAVYCDAKVGQRV